MTEKISFNIDLSELKDFTPTDGLGSNSLLDKDGTYTGLIAKIMLTKAKDGKPMFLVQQIIDDADAKGAMLLHNVLVGGKDRNGDPLIRQLGALMTSCGFPVESIRALSANGSVNADQIVALLVGKRVFFTAEAEAYEGKLSSKIQNYVTKQAYDDAVASNAHRRPRRVNDASFSAAPAGAAAATAALPGLPAPGAAKAADPLQALQGLKLPI